VGSKPADGADGINQYHAVACAQGLLCIFTLAGLAMGAWGMYTLPKNLAGDAWAVVDEVQVRGVGVAGTAGKEGLCETRRLRVSCHQCVPAAAVPAACPFPRRTPKSRYLHQVFAGGLAGSVANVSHMATNMSAPLDRILGVMSDDVDPTGLRSNLTRVSYFLDRAPSPAQFKAAITSLDLALRTQLRGTLSGLAAQLGQGQPLDDLAGDVYVLSTLTSNHIPAMDTILGPYADAVQALLAVGCVSQGGGGGRWACAIVCRAPLHQSMMQKPTLQPSSRDMTPMRLVLSLPSAHPAFQNTVRHASSIKGLAAPQRATSHQTCNYSKPLPPTLTSPRGPDSSAQPARQPRLFRLCRRAQRQTRWRRLRRRSAAWRQAWA
jgi:hypothetical protein